MLTTPTPAWFEIPTVDMDRARRFYGALTKAELREETMGPMTLAIFPHTCPQTTGALVKAPGYEPATTGSVVYLEVDDLSSALARSTAAGGETLMPVTELPDGGGSFAQIRDSEGNRLGLYTKAASAA